MEAKNHPLTNTIFRIQHHLLQKERVINSIDRRNKRRKAEKRMIVSINRQGGMRQACIHKHNLRIPGQQHQTIQVIQQQQINHLEKITQFQWNN